MLHSWHVAMVEVQPLHVLVTASGSRRAVASSFAIAAFVRTVNQEMRAQKSGLWCMATCVHGNNLA